MLHPQIDTLKLEQSPEIFYDRINVNEADMVREIVEYSKRYMSNQHLAKRLPSGFLIAGVGSILRCENPALASDIDLAMVGLKYTSSSGSSKAHSFDDVVEFTKTILGYVEGLTAHFERSRGVEPQSFRIQGGSGPFSLIEHKTNLMLNNEEIGSIRTDLEEFGNYNSKGMQLIFPGMRPVDIQFAFNKTVEEWVCDQSRLEDMVQRKRPFTKEFPYSILYKSQ